MAQKVNCCFVFRWIEAGRGLGRAACLVGGGLGWFGLAIGHQTLPDNAHTLKRTGQSVNRRFITPWNIPRFPRRLLQ